MKRFFQFLAILLLLCFGFSTVRACTCVSDSLGKRFKKAKAVFIGKATNDESVGSSLIQNISNENKYSQTLEVVKNFKGIKKKFISVEFDVEDLKGSTSCPTLYRFEESKQYLVFAYGEKYKVDMVCSDSWEIPSDKESFGYEQMQNYTKKLDIFWFRFWSRIKPF